MKKNLILLFVLAFLLRVSFVFTAFHGDLNNNISWGEIALDNGLANFYGSADANDWPYSAPNQPPLYILMFAGLVWAWRVIEGTAWSINETVGIFPSAFIWFWEAKGMQLIVKLPSILADLGIGYLIYSYLKKIKVKRAIVYTSIWLFNPVVWYNSSIWGQTDSIVNLLGLLSVFALLDKKITKSVSWFTISVLLKGSLLIFTPILVIIAFKQEYTLRKLIHSAIYILLTAILVSIWFHPEPDLLSWLFNLYKTRILPGEVGYLTANAFNFWWLIDSGKVLDSTTYFGLPARIWGLLGTVVGIGGISYLLVRKKITSKRVLFSLAIVSLMTFLFLTRIHERYLYPFFPYATILLGITPGIWIAYSILGFTHLINLYNLFWAPSIKPLEFALQESNLPILIALVNIGVFIYFLRQISTSKL